MSENQETANPTIGENNGNEETANPTIGTNDSSNMKKLNILWNSVPCFVKFCLAYRNDSNFLSLSYDL